MPLSFLAQKILYWYDREGRTLPWRSSQKKANPYHVWLSEVMLQQTVVSTVIPYFLRFIQKWPQLRHLALASQDEILYCWQGLGYYTRAHNLHKCAQMIVSEYEGQFPKNESELLKLPGIGPYTAAAMASIAFGQRSVVVDGNIIRVFSRLFLIDEPRPLLDKLVYQKTAELTPFKRPGDYAQALMDLGARVCTPRAPKCQQCPWNNHCGAFKEGVVSQFPRQTQKKVKPTRYGTVFILQDQKGAYFLEKRPAHGLLGGLIFFPTTLWRENNRWSCKEALSYSPFPQVNWENQKYPSILHTFTHFHLELRVMKGRICENQGIKDRGAQDQCQNILPSLQKEQVTPQTSPHFFWAHLKQFPALAFPTVARKVIHCMLEEIEQ